MVDHLQVGRLKTQEDGRGLVAGMARSGMGLVGQYLAHSLKDSKKVHEVKP